MYMGIVFYILLGKKGAKTMRTLAKILLICGIIALCGTAGASDGEIITILQIFKQILLSVIFFVTSWISHFTAIAAK